MWAYPKVTKHYHNGIPTGTTYSAIILGDSKAQSLGNQREEGFRSEAIESLQTRMPWLLIGFSKELEALWLKDKREFFNWFAQRREARDSDPLSTSSSLGRQSCLFNTT